MRSRLIGLEVLLFTIAACTGGAGGRSDTPVAGDVEDAEWTLSVDPAEVTLFAGERAEVTLRVSRSGLQDVRVEPEGRPESAMRFPDGFVAANMQIDWVETPGDHDVRLIARSPASKRTAATVVRVRQLGDTPGVDTTFGYDGFALTPFPGVSSSQPWLIRALPDRRILVAASGLMGSPPEPVLVLGMLGPAGLADATFGGKGFIRVRAEEANPYSSVRFRDIAADAAGRVLACVTVGDRSVLERYTPDGEIDPTFGVDGTVELDFDVRSVAVDAMGRIITSGEMSFPFEPSRSILRRLLDTGEIDASFADGGSFVRRIDSGPAKVHIGSDDRPVASSCNFDECSLIRLHQDGVLDPSFGLGGIARVEWRKRLAQFDLLPGGGYTLFQVPFETPGGPKNEVVFTRLRANGTLDEGFGPDGLRRHELPFEPFFSVSRDGVAYVAGFDDSSDFVERARWGLARFSATGDLDTAFGRDGTLYTKVRLDALGGDRMGPPVAGAVDPDGRLILAGEGVGPSMFFVRYR